MKNQKLYIRELLNEKWIKPSRIDEYGNMFWYNKYGELHSIGDRPAEIWTNEGKFWYKNGKYHRDGDRSAINLYAEKSWYKNGQLHREGDKPAVISLEGKKQWYKNGELHRDGDKPAVTFLNGDKSWYKNGKFIKRN